jgi:hypothetical protein
MTSPNTDQLDLDTIETATDEPPNSTFTAAAVVAALQGAGIERDKLHEKEVNGLRAELAEAREELAAAVRVSETLNRRLSEEQLAGSALYAALTMPTTPEQRQAALDKFTAVAQQVSGAATELCDLPRGDWELMVHAREDVDALVAEVRRLRDELAETKALNDPRLRGLLVKAAPDKDLYVQWSTVCDMPGGVFSRETALEYGFPRSKVDHADEHGSSSRLGDGAWDDKGWVAEQRGWLRRDLIGEYAVEYLHGDRIAAYALLEPFDDEPESAARPAGAANEDSTGSRP